MTTVVNNTAPAPEGGNGGGFGFLIGVIVFIGFVAVLLYFGIPAIKRMGPVQVNIPATGGGYTGQNKCERRTSEII